MAVKNIGQACDDDTDGPTGGGGGRGGHTLVQHQDSRLQVFFFFEEMDVCGDGLDSSGHPDKPRIKKNTAGQQTTGAYVYIQTHYRAQSAKRINLSVPEKVSKWL